MKDKNGKEGPQKWSLLSIGAITGEHKYTQIVSPISQLVSGTVIV